MALNEFELIRQFFQRRTASDEVLLGVGDDCALLRPPPGMDQAVTVDTLVEGTHFTPDIDPRALGHKSLAVSLSDLAAMGATPSWFTLALTLPHPDEHWLAAFSEGLWQLAERSGAALVGGDTTRGPCSITIQAGGWLPAGCGLRRDGARPGDLVYVTGSLGAAGLGLMVALHDYRPPAGHGAALRRALDWPEPRVDIGPRLLGMATAAIDVSDGLLADLGHITGSSHVGATLHLDRLPLSEEVQAYVDATGDHFLPLGAGEDYELCFTVAAAAQADLESRADGFGCPVHWIGLIDADPGLRIVAADGEIKDATPSGYRHFE